MKERERIWWPRLDEALILLVNPRTVLPEKKTSAAIELGATGKMQAAVNGLL